MTDMQDETQPLTKGESRLTLAEFRGDMAALREDIRTLLRPIQAALVRHDAELADIRDYMKDRLVTRDEFHGRMDAFAGRVDGYRYHSAKDLTRLDDHERRLSALERKDS